MEGSLLGRGRGSGHPTALTANPLRARDASARPSPPQRSQVVRQATAGSKSAGRLVMARGGASGRWGLWETSASGATAIAFPGTAGPSSCPWYQTPAPRVPKSRLPSAGCQPSQPVMLQHLSSLPTQMVRARPQDPPHAAPPPLSEHRPCAARFLAWMAALQSLS